VIVKQFGKKVESVRPNFDARAMTEIGFTRDSEYVEPSETFFDSYEKREVHEIGASTEGDVQSEGEERLLASLEEQLLAIEKSAPDNAVVVIVSEQGVDYPKTRNTQTTVVVDGANRLHFRFTVEPPLRVAVYQRR
jgi:hypothetical protein